MDGPWGVWLVTPRRCQPRPRWSTATTVARPPEICLPLSSLLYWDQEGNLGKEGLGRRGEAEPGGRREVGGMGGAAEVGPAVLAHGPHAVPGVRGEVAHGDVGGDEGPGPVLRVDPLPAHHFAPAQSSSQGQVKERGGRDLSVSAQTKKGNVGGPF